MPSRLSRGWHDFFYGPVLLGFARVACLSGFEKFVRLPKTNRIFTEFMSKLEICISTAFDYRRMQKPKALEKQLADLNPSANSKTLLWDWALPLREWRLEKAEKIKKDFNRLTRLLLDDKTTFPVLRDFRCFVSRTPPNIDPKPASMPLDDEVIFQLGRRMVKYRGFIITHLSSSDVEKPPRKWQGYSKEVVEGPVGDWDSGELEILDRKKEPVQRDSY